MKTALHLLSFVALTAFFAGTARAQLATEETLYTFGQKLGFFGPLAYPPLVQAPGNSNNGLTLYGLLPVTGNGSGGSGVFAYSNPGVGTIYADPNGSSVSNVFLGDGGTTAYAVSGQGLLSLPGNRIISPNVLNPIIKASDGTFYGFGTNEFDRITTGSAATITPVSIGPIQLIQATDGNFYVIGIDSFVRITQNSTVTPLYSFPNSVSTPAGIIEAPLSEGTVFYGFRASGTGAPDYSGSGIIFSFTTNPGGGSVALNILHNLAADGSEGRRPTSLVLGRDGNLYGVATSGGANSAGTFFRVTTRGDFTVLYSFDSRTGGGPVSVAQLSDGNFYVVNQYGGTSGGQTISEMLVHPSFFAGEVALSNGVNYLQLPGGNPFGYYSYLSDPHYIYHFDLGYEYVFDANDGKGGIYLYDFASNGFFYTSPSFPFPYLYDFSLQSVIYYYPDTQNVGHYTTNPRYFFNFATGTIFTK